MKLKAFPLALSLTLAGLLGYFIYYITKSADYDLLWGIGATICFAITAIPILGTQYESARQGLNLKVLSGVFLIAFVISHICFARLGADVAYYIIVNGCLMVAYLALFYKISSLQMSSQNNKSNTVNDSNLEA
ncbi:hypothetical protein [Porphyromonas uenonis]|jgi:hypothetical protein|uniref:hypothetical protein n=1 Tax=Porphyromonas uenonis TaxID=281920 RepID=UPI00288BA1C5|nr:hypothetical protein [Porphyromonas uenonis]